MKALEKIRQAVREQRYRISDHADDEMSEDNLEAADIERVLLSGEIARKFTRDPRGTRYEVIGKSTDGRWTGVVCRFLPSGILLYSLRVIL